MKLVKFVLKIFKKKENLKKYENKTLHGVGITIRDKMTLIFIKLNDAATKNRLLKLSNLKVL